MSDGAFALLVAGAFLPTLLTLALVIKYWEVRRARHWPDTNGKVIESVVEARRRQPGESGYHFGDTEVLHEPKVVYEYKVAGKTYRHRRIHFGERTSAYELESYLARYPVGADVTVYYNPADPQDAILERNPFTAGMWAAIGCVMLFLIGTPLLIAVYYFQAADWLKPHLANPQHAPFVAALGGFGLVVLFFALGLTATVWQACRWPIVRGRVVSSGVENFMYGSGDSPPAPNSKAAVVYEYEINGRKYRGDRVSFAAALFVYSSAALSARTAARYPPGTAVDVHYHPKRPSESILKPFSLIPLFPWGIALVIFYFVWTVATGRAG